MRDAKDEAITPAKIAEFAHDLQTGLAQTRVPQFDRLPIVGMASIVAMHIRGLGEIPYDTLRQVADFYFDVPGTALPEVLRVLEEIEYVQLISKSATSIKAVIPQVPHFQSVHDGLGDYVSTLDLTEFEQVSIAILNELTSKAEKRDTVFGRIGAEKMLSTRAKTSSSLAVWCSPNEYAGNQFWLAPRTLPITSMQLPIWQRVEVRRD